MSPSGCIQVQFQKLGQLSPQDRELLDQLEKDPRHYPAGTVLCEAGANATCFFTVRQGWACATKNLADGQRQILDIFLPGQIMGLREIGFNQALSDFVALTDLEACPFPRQRLGEVFAHSPRLADLFFLVLAREQAMLTERVINIGRRPAVERLAHFLLEMKVRLDQPREEFELPLNQSVIGDALGLSSVHVSRTLRELREKGLVEMQNGSVKISDLEGLLELSGFNRAYLEGESNWARQD